MVTFSTMVSRQLSHIARRCGSPWCLVLAIAICIVCTDAQAKSGAAHIQDALKVSLDSNAKNGTPLWDMIPYIQNLNSLNPT